MQRRRIKLYAVLLCFISIFSETMLFSQATEEKPAEEKQKIEPGTLSDNTYFENANYLYKIKEYDKALTLLSEYLEIYMYGLHRKEAYKDIASIYFEQFNYIKSIKIYNSLYEEYSNSEEGIEACFLAGICYQKMGYLEKAKQTFKLIIEDHPESNFAYQAKIKLDLLEILERG